MGAIDVAGLEQELGVTDKDVGAARTACRRWSRRGRRRSSSRLRRSEDEPAARHGAAVPGCSPADAGSDRLQRFQRGSIRLRPGRRGSGARRGQLRGGGAPPGGPYGREERVVAEATGSARASGRLRPFYRVPGARVRGTDGDEPRRPYLGTRVTHPRAEQCCGAAALTLRKGQAPSPGGGAA